MCPEKDCCGGFTAGFASIAAGTPIAELPTGVHVYTIRTQCHTPDSSPMPQAVPVTQHAVLSSAAPLLAPVRLRMADLDDDGIPDALVQSTCGPLILTGIAGGIGREAGGAAFSADTPLATPVAVAVSGENSLIDATLLGTAVRAPAATVEAATTVLRAAAALRPNVTRALPFAYDINNDGRLDVLVMYLPPEDDTTSELQLPAAALNVTYGIFGFWHTPTSSNYFISTLMVNGVQPIEEVKWGALQPGATMRFQYTDILQALHTASGTQLGAVSHLQLAPVRVHFGVGITFSSIQNFAAGTRVASAGPDGAHTSWATVYLPPNAEILCNPYPLSDPSDWVIRLYLLGQLDMNLVLIVCGVALTLLTIPIAILGLREIRTDRFR
jgi:hypothetical protein